VGESQSCYVPPLTLSRSSTGLFRTWYPEPLTAITLERIESWKGRRLNTGRKGTTVLRDLFALSSVLSRAVKVGELPENPVRRVDKPRIDRRPKVRFLDDAEERRLRDALHAATCKCAKPASLRMSGGKLVTGRCFLPCRSSEIT
jgi:site-specific recombinase XerD